MFVPVFFVSIGLQANARALGPQIAFVAVLVLVAIVAPVESPTLVGMAQLRPGV